MNKERIKLITVIAGALLFNLVFWQEKMALNTVLYDLFIIATLFYLYPEARHVSTVRWLTLGHLLCLAMVVVNNTMLSKTGFTITLVLLAGFIEYVHRSVWFATGSMLFNGVYVAASLKRSFTAGRQAGPRKKRNAKFLRFAVIPLILVVIFFMIYSSANSVFSEATGRVSEAIGQFFGSFFEVVSLGRIGFLLFGMFITAWIILQSKERDFEKLEKQYGDTLVRRRKSRLDKDRDFMYSLSETLMGKLVSGVMALKNMNTVGFISLVLLNILLLVINIIDVRYIWFGFEYGQEVNLYKMIHEGTDLLIISILLAIAVLMIFFKGNLNFYKANKWLKYGAYAWIIQNSILVISVFLRDYYYISKTGLAYKRIGVLFYLALVIVGLVSVFWKIYARKTTYFLFRVNAWALVIALVASTTVNWDEFIASYNFRYKDEILMPVDYMVTLSNKAIPLLDQNVQVLREQYQKQKDLGFITHSCDDCFVAELKREQSKFLKEQEQYTWLSYNFADESVKQYLEQKKQLTVK